MKTDLYGKLYIAIMSVYFVVSGLNALFNIDEKLARIGLSAVDADGKIAFILIYCSLMIGIGVAIALLYYLSKKWHYPAVLASTIVMSFICFRVIGAIIVGELSNTQLSFILAELFELTIGVTLLVKSNEFSSEKFYKNMQPNS